MGLDLTLLPIRNSEINEDKWWLGYTRLSFDRDYELFDFFGGDRAEKHNKIINDKPLPDDVTFDSYCDDGCKAIKKNPYGEPLTWFYAKDLKKLNFEPKSQWNSAILQMLKLLPDNIKIVLEWR